MKNTRIALVQMQSTAGDIKNNLIKIEKYVAEASKQKVDIICFPELSVHGYSNKIAEETAEFIPGKSSNYLKKIAVENNITILVGLCEKEILKDSKFCKHKRSECYEEIYITQLICFKDGNIKKYRKIHLGERESKIYDAGEDIEVFNTGKFNFGIQICFDAHFPELSTIQSLKGAEIIFIPHSSPSKVGNRREIWLKYLTARAYDNSVYIACCNAVGDNGEGKSFAGGVIAIDPKGNVIDEDFRGKEGVLILDL